MKKIGEENGCDNVFEKCAMDQIRETLTKRRENGEEMEMEDGKRKEILAEIPLFHLASDVDLMKTLVIA